MNIQLDFQGQQIDVPLQDTNAVCQYLYDFAQNGFLGQVQLFFALPDGSRGDVDPSWSIAELIQAGAKFFVNPIQQGGNIMINIFLEDQPLTDYNANSLQSLDEVLEYVNSNMQTQYQESELYDSKGNALTNTPTDTLEQFVLASFQPFLLFIPKCQSGIQNFVQLKAPQLSQLLIEVFYLNQKCADILVESQQNMQELLALQIRTHNNKIQPLNYLMLKVIDLAIIQLILLANIRKNNNHYNFMFLSAKFNHKLQVYVGSNKYQEIFIKPDKQLSEIVNDISNKLGIQIDQFELLSQTGKKLSKNLDDEFGKYSLEQQPLMLTLNYTQSIHIKVYINRQFIFELEVSSDLSIQDVLDEIGEIQIQKYTEYVIIDNNFNALSINNPSDQFNSFNLSSEPIHMYIIFNNQIFEQQIQKQTSQMESLTQMPNILIYSFDQKVLEIHADQQLTLQEVLDFVNEINGMSETLFELQDSQGLVLTNNPVFTVGQFQNFRQPLHFCIQSIKKTGFVNNDQFVPQSQNKVINLIVFVNNEFSMQLQPDKGQTIQQIIDIINQNLSGKVFLYELYHKTKNHILSINSPNDKFEQFSIFSEPLILMCHTAVLNSHSNSQQYHCTFGQQEK